MTEAEKLAICSARDTMTYMGAEDVKVQVPEGFGLCAEDHKAVAVWWARQLSKRHRRVQFTNVGRLDPWAEREICYQIRRACCVLWDDGMTIKEIGALLPKWDVFQCLAVYGRLGEEAERRAWGV